MACCRRRFRVGYSTWTCSFITLHKVIMDAFITCIISMFHLCKIVLHSINIRSIKKLVYFCLVKTLAKISNARWCVCHFVSEYFPVVEANGSIRVTPIFVFWRFLLNYLLFMRLTGPNLLEVQININAYKLKLSMIFTKAEVLKLQQ